VSGPLLIWNDRANWRALRHVTLRLVTLVIRTCNRLTAPALPQFLTGAEKATSGIAKTGAADTSAITEPTMHLSRAARNALEEPAIARSYRTPRTLHSPYAAEAYPGFPRELFIDPSSARFPRLSAPAAARIGLAPQGGWGCIASDRRRRGACGEC